MTNIILIAIYLTLPILVQSQLTHTDPLVNEGACRGYPSLSKRLQYLSSPAILARLSGTNTGMIILGSEGMFRTYVEMFLGRPAKNLKEIQEMCVTIMCSLTLCTQIGFKDRIYTSLGLPGSHFGVFSFANPIAMSPGVVEIPYEDGIVWATEEQYLLVRCVERKVRDWKLLSLTPPSNEVKQRVLSIVEQLGFNRSLALDLSSHCPIQPSVSEAMTTTLNSLGFIRKDSKVAQSFKNFVERFSKN